MFNFMRRVTQLDIAKALGVSPSTVGLVVGNIDSPLRRHLNKDTIRRIEEKAKEMGYMPNRAARAMRKGRTNLIVFLHMSSGLELLRDQVNETGRLVHEMGYDYQVVDAYWWVGDGRRVIEQIIALHPEGVIIAGSIQAPMDFSLLRKAGIAMVALNANIPGVAHIRHEVHNAIRQLTRAILADGRTRPVLVLHPITPLNNTWQQQHRLLGFRAALKELGKGAPQECMISEGKPLQELDAPAICYADIRCSSRNLYEPGYHSARLIGTAADAVITTNDQWAAGAATYYIRHGIKIPDQVAISGFDDDSVTRFGLVYLTTVKHPTLQMCQAAIELLTIQMRSAKVIVEEQVFPCEIVWRESLPQPGVSIPKTSSIAASKVKGKPLAKV